MIIMMIPNATQIKCIKKQWDSFFCFSKSDVDFLLGFSSLGSSNTSGVVVGTRL
jgi:hypothetical protein